MNRNDLDARSLVAMEFGQVRSHLFDESPHALGNAAFGLGTASPQVGQDLVGELVRVAAVRHAGCKKTCCRRHPGTLRSGNLK